MGRKKVIEKIKNAQECLITYNRRIKGLFKKASELGVLCGVNISIILSDPMNNLHHYSNNPYVTYKTQEGFLNGFKQFSINSYSDSNYPFIQTNSSKDQPKLKKSKISKVSDKYRASLKKRGWAEFEFISGTLKCNKTTQTITDEKNCSGQSSRKMSEKTLNSSKTQNSQETFNFGSSFFGSIGKTAIQFEKMYQKLSQLVSVKRPSHIKNDKEQYFEGLDMKGAKLFNKAKDMIKHKSEIKPREFVLSDNQQNTLNIFHRKMNELFYFTHSNQEIDLASDFRLGLLSLKVLIEAYFSSNESNFSLRLLLCQIPLDEFLWAINMSEGGYLHIPEDPQTSTPSLIDFGNRTPSISHFSYESFSMDGWESKIPTDKTEEQEEIPSHEQKVKDQKVKRVEELRTRLVKLIHVLISVLLGRSLNDRTFSLKLALDEVTSPTKFYSIKQQFMKKIFVLGHLLFLRKDNHHYDLPDIISKEACKFSPALGIMNGKLFFCSIFQDLAVFTVSMLVFGVRLQ